MSNADNANVSSRNLARKIKWILFASFNRDTNISWENKIAIIIFNKQKYLPLNWLLLQSFMKLVPKWNIKKINLMKRARSFDFALKQLAMELL